MKLRILLIAMICGLLFSACAASEPTLEPLPPAETDAESGIGIDKNINMSNIDNYLDREDVAYRDVRLFFDPAAYEEIGGNADISQVIDGFLVIPYPYISTIGPLPVSGAYEGLSLFNVEWTEDSQVASITPNYLESEMILEEMFPKDKNIFLMCGGGGYSMWMKNILIHSGWDADKVYNVGGEWTYEGNRSQEIIIYPEFADGDKIYATWRAEYAYIPFEKLNPI